MVSCGKRRATGTAARLGHECGRGEPLLPRLTARFEVTVIELPGHGGSDAASAADLDDWALRCVAVAPPQAHWVGWSLGGQVALQVALRAPSRITGLS